MRESRGAWEVLGVWRMGKTSEIFCYRSYRLRHLLFLLHRRHHGLLLLVLLAVHCEQQR